MHIIYYSKVYQKGNGKKKTASQKPRSTFHLEEWDMYFKHTQMHSLKIKWIQRLLNENSAS